MRAASLVLASALLLAAPAAHAQDARAEARERFTRAVELYDQGHYQAALAEFQRAYALAPAAPVLFNIAQVHAALGHAVSAIDAYQRYLAEAPSVSEARRAEVEEALATQRTRVSRLVIDTNALGATIAIDDVDVGTAPLDRAIDVDAGEHVVSARAPGYESVRRRLRIAGSREERVRLELLSSDQPRGALRIVATLPGAEILIDDHAVGLTPVEGTIAVVAGPHRVRVRRDGYIAREESVTVEADAEREIRFALERDPAAQEGSLGRVRLVLPEAEWSIRVDGEELHGGARSIELPAGPHDVVITVARREPWRGRIEVPTAAVAEVAPDLQWTPEAVAERSAAIDTDLAIGIGLLAGGAVALGAGGALWAWNQDEWQRLVAEYQPILVVCNDPDPMVSVDCMVPPGYPTIDSYEEHVNRQRQIRLGTDVGAIATMATGGVLAVVGVVVLATMPPRIERRRLDVSLGISGVALSGTF